MYSYAILPYFHCNLCHSVLHHTMLCFTTLYYAGLLHTTLHNPVGWTAKRYHTMLYFLSIKKVTSAYPATQGLLSKSSEDILISRLLCCTSTEIYYTLPDILLRYILFHKGGNGILISLNKLDMAYAVPVSYLPISTY